MKYKKFYFKSLYLVTLVLSLIIVVLLYKKLPENRINQSNQNSLEAFFLKIPTSYIFWTGGFDSTFRILEALLIDKIKVVPIYISGIIDNDPSKSTRRKNNKQELQSLRKIIKTIYEIYPNFAKNLKPLIIIPEVKLSNHVINCMDILYKKKMVRRPVCQYGALAQVCLDMNRPIELAVEKEPQSSMMYSSIYNKVEGNKNNRKIKASVLQKQPELEIYKHFIFSTLHYSKKEMLAIAIKNGFDNILKMTWSCWYPQNGNPCGRCIMCHERPI